MIKKVVMKQSKVFFNDETDLKIEALKLERKSKGTKEQKGDTCSFIIQDYFTLISKIKASIEETKGSACSYKKEEVLKYLEGLL